MRILLMLLLSVSIFSSCKSVEPELPSISGETVGVFDGLRIYLKQVSPEGTQTYLDTAIVIGNKFDFGEVASTEFPEIRFLELDTAPEQFNFISENESINLIIYKDSMLSSKIEGGLENELFSNYRNLRLDHRDAYRDYQMKLNQSFEKEDEAAVEIVEKDWKSKEKAYNETILKFTEENPDRIVATLALDYLYGAKFIDEIEARKRYEKLSDAIKSNPITRHFDTNLKKVEVTAIGKNAPYFEGKNPDGELIKLPEILGKATLIDFWASWCAPCRVENPNIVAAYQKYHEKGFHILSVSLDKPDAKDQWVEAIRQDQMNWNHISRLSYWNDPIATQYNVFAIPANFLLDKDGTIVAKDLRGKNLQNKLAELLD